MPKIISGLTAHNERVQSFLKPTAGGIVIQGPTPDTDIGNKWPKLNTRFQIGTLKLSKGTRPIVLELGTASKQGGRVIGFGHLESNKANKKVAIKQWVRMDWHDPHNSNNSAEYWYDNPFYFHLNEKSQ